MARSDGKARMPWSVKGVSPEARDLAKSATARDGDTMGEWLSDVIRRVGAAEAAGRPVHAPTQRHAPAVAGRRTLTPDSRVPPPGRPGYPTAPAVRPATTPAATPSAATATALETVDEEALSALIVERVDRSETRLVGVLQSLEEIVSRLADRIDQLEDQLQESDARNRRTLPPF